MMLCQCPSCGKMISRDLAKRGSCFCGQSIRVRRNGDVGYQISFSNRSLRARMEVKNGHLRTT